MRRHAALALTCILWATPAICPLAQTPATESSATPDSSPEQVSTLSARSTLVLVPALVRNKAGELVFTLKADDFVLTDDGIPQKLTLEEDTGGEPLALVIDIEGGRSALRELKKFIAIGPMIDSIIGKVPHRVAVVGFDSSPVLVTDFTADTATAAQGIQDLIADNSGDDGAAILDSLGFSVDLLRRQPPQYRRAVLLISETNGDSSNLQINEALREISDTNATIYSVGFSTGKSKAKEIWSGLKSPPPPSAGCDSTGGCFSLMPEVKMAMMAAIVTADGLRRNVPETVARLTGGEYFQFGDEKSLASDLQIISNHIPNRYVLSFQPQSPHPGFHILTLQLPDYVNLKLSARNGYWAGASGAAASPGEAASR